MILLTRSECGAHPSNTPLRGAPRVNDIPVDVPDVHFGAVELQPIDMINTWLDIDIDDGKEIVAD